jgi:formate hydrogenlyase subunit 3/multisubunit Na+/H+ antiporter MnhD subunit
MPMLAVIALLVLIVVLLCTPRKNRPQQVKYSVASVAIIGCLYYLGPIAIGIVLASYHFLIGHLGRFWSLVLAIAIVLGFVFAGAWWIDARDNRAIRAGSRAAFEKRVQTLIRDRKYSHEKAVEAVSRLRDQR